MDLYELIEHCQQDDKIAIEELVKRNERKVYSALYHLDPKRTDLADLTQEALYRMATKIKTLKNIRTFNSWLNQILTNLFYDELRRKSRRLSTISMDNPITSKEDEGAKQTQDIKDKEPMPEEKTLGKELDDTIKNAIESLPEQFKIVIVLRELQGLSYDEIANVTSTNVGTVKSRLARARSKLQEMILPYIKQRG